MFHVLTYLTNYKESRVTQKTTQKTGNRTTVILREVDKKRLHEIMAIDGVSKTEAIKRALATELFFAQARERRESILLENADGKLREVLYHA